MCRMHAEPDRPEHGDGRVTVTFDTFAIELPEPLDGLVLEQLCPPRPSLLRQPAPTIGCFPEGIPGNHLGDREHPKQLVAAASSRPSARKAAMFGLAAEIPTPILADILGLAATTAVRWATLACARLEAIRSPRRETSISLHSGNTTHFEYDPSAKVGLARGGRWWSSALSERCGTRAVPARGAGRDLATPDDPGVGLSLPDGVRRGR